MKLKLTIVVLAAGLLLSFTLIKTKNAAINLNGTWQLLSGTTITKGVSTFTDYTKGEQMIKIMNDTHFGFLSTTSTAKKIQPIILMQAAAGTP